MINYALDEPHGRNGLSGQAAVCLAANCPICRLIVRMTRSACMLGRRDGKEMFYQYGGTFFAVDVKTDGAFFEVGLPRPLFDAATVADTGVIGGTPFVVSSDGQRFLVLVTAEKQDGPPLEVLVNWR